MRRLVAERRIPYVKVGRFVRFDPIAVTAWIDTCRIVPLPLSHPLGNLNDEEPSPRVTGVRSGSQRSGAA